MSQRPPRDLDWIPDDATDINVPSQTKQNAGWIVEKPARQFFNWLANRQSRWTHYFSGQSQEFIVIDSTNANEKDYDTLAAYIADSPAAGDKVLVKETQALTAQMIIPAGITLRILGGITFTRTTLEASSVIKFGSDVIIEGVLNLVLSHTGTTAKAFEFDGDDVSGKVNVENSSTGTLTTAFHINASKTGNALKGFVKNTGGGAITNIGADSSTEDSNLLQIIDKTSKQIFRSLGSNTFFTGFKFLLGSDADGDIYYRDAGILKRLAKGSDRQSLELVSGIPAWVTNPSFSVHKNGSDQTISSSSPTKVTWSTEEFDTNSDFASSRFTPTVAKKYQLNVGLLLQNLTNNQAFALLIYKNGIVHRQVRIISPGTLTIAGVMLSTVVEANGSTDYFEVYVDSTGDTSYVINGSSTDSQFTGSSVS